MDISVEITLSPLQDNYEEAVIRFIKSLRASGLKVLENPLSTQVYGEYNKVMQVLQQEIRSSLENMEQGVFTIKVVKTDRSSYEPHF
ncbi:thiamine-binding protein [Robiginitalea sp. IMCC44478]|uniref:thiamine-binding protein n=1 Tax=Robiginitalea sp. IMCC44478 TaxID=3459122 RepID=UPI00404158CA